MSITLSIIVPVYDGAATLEACLAALRREMLAGDELIVIDDASTDASGAIAAAAGADVVRLPANRGQAAGRNVGASKAQGEVLFFVDADVVVHPGAAARVRATFAARPEIAAVFGSYDDAPPAPGTVAAYRNLLHHWVHQQGSADAFSFWAGCGAVRRVVFAAVGGFDERPWRRAIEDIELGYRLRASGHRILLDHGLLSTHLKRWTLRSMLWTDVALRAVPWTRLMREMPSAGGDLNLTLAQRASVALVGLGLATLLLAPWRPWLASLGVTALATVAFLNRDFYAFLARRRGLGFALASIPLHLLYFVCSGLGYAWASAGHAFGHRAPARDSEGPPARDSEGPPARDSEGPPARDSEDPPARVGDRPPAPSSS
jgi:GT2 family glycosyltransferase